MLLIDLWGDFSEGYGMHSVVEMQRQKESPAAQPPG